MGDTMAKAAVFRLVLALVVLPVILTFARRLRVVSDSKVWAIATVGAVYASYVFTLVEDVAMHDVLNLLQHVMYGVAGVCALRTAVVVRRTVVIGPERA